MSGNGNTDFPRNWDWDGDGDTVQGSYVRVDEAPTSYGEKPILVLEVGGEERSVWLLATALRNRFADEVAKRPNGDLTIGEQVVIERGEMRTSSSDRQYRAFTARFPDRPRRSAASILGAGRPETEPAESMAPGPADDDIPF